MEGGQSVSQLLLTFDTFFVCRCVSLYVCDEAVLRRQGVSVYWMLEHMHLADSPHGCW